MAYKNAITRWLLNNKHLMALSFTQYDWPSNYLQGVYDFSAQIDFNGIQSEGRGIGFNPELALEKASAEAIERYICQKLKISSVGVAVSGANSSLDHASLEALERYYLNKHLKQEIPLHQIDEVLYLDFKIATILKDFKLQNNLKKLNKKTEVFFFRMQTPNDLFGIVCVIRSIGELEMRWEKIYSYGFSVSKHFNHSLEKAFLEALPNFIALLENRYRNHLKKPWHLSLDFSEKINSLLFGNDENKFYFYNSQYNPNKIIYPILEILKIKWDQFPELKDCPIDPIQVTYADKEFVDKKGDLL